MIALFVFLAIAQVVLTELYYAGVHDQGVGNPLLFEWPSWLITALDASAVGLLWFGHRRGAARPWAGLMAAIAVMPIVVGRADWIVIPPVLAVVVLVNASARLVATRRAM